MLFIASLITTLGAAFIFEKCESSRAEVAIACVPIILISLVLALIFAPWQFQLLLLVLALAFPLTRPSV